jgi:cytochrome c-type biogenesis protein CcmE
MFGSTGIGEKNISESGGSWMKKRRFHFVMLTLVVMGIIGYLIFSGMQDTMGYYLTVSELIEQSPQLAREKVRVSGKVNEGSVNRDPAGQTLEFAIIDGNTALLVEYHGVVPDSFKQ